MICRKQFRMLMPIGAEKLLSALKLTEENMRKLNRVWRKLKRILALAAVLATVILTGYLIYTGVRLNKGEAVIEQVQSIQHMF